jgi:hypothetical protein
MKLIFVIFFIFLALCTIMFFITHRASQQELGGVHKQKYLCDKTVADCNKTSSPHLPKGVCAPGGVCS